MQSEEDYQVLRESSNNVTIENSYELSQMDCEENKKTSETEWSESEFHEFENLCDVSCDSLQEDIERGLNIKGNDRDVCNVSPVEWVKMPFTEEILSCIINPNNSATEGSPTLSSSYKLDTNTNLYNEGYSEVLAKVKESCENYQKIVLQEFNSIHPLATVDQTCRAPQNTDIIKLEERELKYCSLNESTSLLLDNQTTSTNESDNDTLQQELKIRGVASKIESEKPLLVSKLTADKFSKTTTLNLPFVPDYDLDPTGVYSCYANVSPVQEEIKSPFKSFDQISNIPPPSSGAIPKDWSVIRALKKGRKLSATNSSSKTLHPREKAKH